MGAAIRDSEPAPGKMADVTVGNGETAWRMAEERKRIPMVPSGTTGSGSMTNRFVKNGRKEEGLIWSVCSGVLAPRIPNSSPFFFPRAGRCQGVGNDWLLALRGRSLCHCL